MKTKNIVLCAVGLLCLVSTARLDAQESFKAKAEANARSITMEKKPTMGRVENDYASFSVLVDVDRRDRCYKENDLLTVTVKASREGYLYLIHMNEAGKETLLIPSEFQQDNKIEPNKTVSYPAPDADFQFRVTPPFGREKIKAVVTNRRLKSIDLNEFTKAPATALSATRSKSLVEELGGSKDIVTEAKPSAGKPEFATHEVVYTTHSQSGRSAAAKGTRYALCFGVGKYDDKRIQPLEAAAKDAQAVGDLLTNYCGVEKKNCAVLTDDKVTRETVRNIFCDVLPNTTRPDDIIFVYWSGHGGRYSATHGSASSSQYTTYLVPFDGKRSDPENTMLPEGPFGQWVQRISGRKLYFILDACYSGGMPQRAKGMNDENGGESSFRDAILGSGSKSLDGAADPEDIAFHFCFSNFARSKALGQDGLVVLASSTKDQLSWEREDGNLSVMTHCLIDAIKDGPRNMTHKDIKEPVKRGVEQYNHKYRPNAAQTVVEQDDLNPGLVLKP